MDEKSNQADVVESSSRNESVSTTNEDEKRNVNDTNEEVAADNTYVDDEEKVDFGQSFESDDDGFVVTIGDIETKLPSQRNIHEFSNQYKPPSRMIINYPTTEEIQQKLKAAMEEKQQLSQIEKTNDEIKIPQKNNLHQNIDAAPFIMPFQKADDIVLISDYDIHNRLLRSKKRVSINKAAAEKLPPLIRDIVTNVAENQQPVHIPTVNFSTSAAPMKSIANETEFAKVSSNFKASKPLPSSSSAEATVSLPPEYNPKIPPPSLPTKTNNDKKRQERDDPITPVQALLRQYSNEGPTKPEVSSSYPDKNVREQHQRQIDRNRRRDTNRIDNDNYYRPRQFFPSVPITRRRSRSRSPLQQDYRADKNNVNLKSKFSKSAYDSR